MEDDYDTLLKKYANKSERPKDEEEGALDEHEDQSRDRRRKEGASRETDKRRADKSRDKRDRSRDRRRSRERSRERRRSSRERERSRDRKRSRERSRDRNERHKSREKSRDRSAAMEIDAAPGETSEENKWGGLRERSVDEWDKLRAELGLPPLEKSSAAPASSASDAPASSEAKTSAHEMSLADKLEVMKHARLMKQKEKKVKTLGDADSDDEQVSSVDWIQRSRAIEEEKKRALMRQRMLEEEEEQARALRPVSVQGLKVGHELTQLDADLREGEERVLTLKDNYILDEHGQEDELLDTTLLEKEKWEKIHQAKKKKSRYELLDDPQASVLSKYDEEKKKEGFVLTNEGLASAPDTRPSPDEVRDKLQRAAQSLDTPAPSASSDYWTNEEMAEFKKNSSAKKKKRKLRKKSTLSELFAQEEAHPQQGADEDLASRTERQQRQEEQTAQDRDTRLQRWKNYDKALEKAQGDAQTLFDRPQRGAAQESEVTYHEDEEDLFRELARARKLAARDKKKKRPEEVVSELLTSVKREAEPASAPHNEEELVFTESTEFVRSLPTEQDERQEEQERKLKRERRTVHVKKEPAAPRDEDALMREIDADMPVIRPPAPRRTESGGEEVPVKDEPMAEARTAETENESVQKEHAALSEAMGDTGAEVRGVGGMLAMLRTMGESAPSTSAGKKEKKEKDERRHNNNRLDAELALGRATDKRVLEVPLHDERETEALQRRYRHELGMLKKPLNLSGITLEHHDQETGRVLTPKEAFRRMSYVFHGKGPGKNKAEKRKKQDEKRLKQLTQHSMGTETISMQEMQKIQQENKTPYIVLGASAKIFQARDTKPLSTPSTSASNTNNGAASVAQESSEYGISLPSHRPKIELSFKAPAKK